MPTLEEALADCSASIAFACWAESLGVAERYSDTERLFAAWPGAPPGGGKLALVFGREDDGLTEEEVRRCSAVCTLPTGRLQESLSVSHAVVIALSHLFQKRTLALAAGRACASASAGIGAGG